MAQLPSIPKLPTPPQTEQPGGRIRVIDNLRRRAFVVSLLVLAGWVWDVEALKALPRPNPVAMNPLWAVGFLLCAGAGNDGDGVVPKSVLDREKALDYAGDGATLRELAEIFQEECPKLMGAVREALARSDAVGLDQLMPAVQGLGKER
jgi:hypothetical protein